MVAEEGSIDILHLIDHIEAIVTSGRRIPLFNRVILDEEVLLATVDQMRISVPQDVKEAQQLLEQRHTIINQALAEAERITEAAEQEFQARLENTYIIKAAEKRAQEMISNAEQHASSLVAEAEREALAKKREAEAYTINLLRQLENQLSSYLTSIRRGIDAVEDRPAEEPKLPVRPPKGAK